MNPKQMSIIVKTVSVFNTLLAFLYFFLVQSGKTSGVYAFMVLFAFGLGVVCQWVVAGMTRPVKMTVRYVLIVASRALLFLSVPYLTTLPLRISFVLILPVLDYLQAGLPVHPTFFKELTEAEKERSKLYYKTAFSGGLILFLVSYKWEYIATGGIMFFLALLWIMKQEKSRLRTVLITEWILAALLNLALYFGFIPISMHEIITVVSFVLIVVLHYKCLKDFDKSHKDAK